MMEESSTGTAVAKTPQWRKDATQVRKAANLPQEEWADERVFALMRLLPEDFQDPLNAIAYITRAVRAGLDPFTNEIWAWADRGKLTFHTGRDGWVRTARNDEDIEGLEFGLIYDGDEFNWHQEGMRVKIDHKGGLSQGRVIGAYCVVHMVNMDHLERRSANDYKHLMNKDNWRNYLPDMLLTRVVAAAVKFCSPLGAGIDVPPEYAPDVYMQQQGGTEVLRRKMDDKSEKLGQQLSNGGREVVVDETPDDIGYVPEEDEEAEEMDFPCPYCEKRFETGPSLGGHMGTHKAERVLEGQLVDSGYKIQNEDGVFLVVEPGGAYHDVDPTTGEPWESWGDAALYVKLELSKQEAPEPLSHEALDAMPEPAPPADADPEEVDRWIDGNE